MIGMPNPSITYPSLDIEENSPLYELHSVLPDAQTQVNAIIVLFMTLRGRILLLLNSFLHISEFRSPCSLTDELSCRQLRQI
jgi:hypothetical protein